MTTRKTAAAAGALAGAAALAAAALTPAARAADDAPPEKPRLTAASDVVLPNLDDDARRCRLRPGDLDRLDLAVDERLAACHDAADDVVNGPRDADDLTTLRVEPMAVGDAAVGRVSLPAAQRPYARVFVERGGRLVALGDGGRLTAAELRGGARLAVEGRDVVRDPARWDGRITVSLAVTDGGVTRDAAVHLHVAPVLLQNDLQAAQRLIAAAPGPGEGVPAEVPAAERRPGGWAPFARSLRGAVADAGLPDGALRFQSGGADWWRDIWRQDIVEPGYVSRPLPGGGAHTLRILLRSPNYWASGDGRAASLRRAGRLLFRDWRGPDVGVVQQYTADRDPGVDELQNFTGNVESVPPFPGHPQGRILYGATPRRHPDRSFTALLAAQGAQSPVVLDTSWLLVGHVDETVHVVRADNPRGWTLAVADPRLAVRLLERVRDAGGGGRRLFDSAADEDRLTVDQYLAYDRESGSNADAARHIDGQLRVLLRATGLRESDLVRLPVLYAKAGDDTRPEGLLAYSPAVVNGLSLTARDFAAPIPHGPRLDGRDVLRAETEARLRATGVTVHWVEDFSWAHMSGGEVHCATNALRDVTPAGGSTAPVSRVTHME
ncbi:protein-arginine deiminase family protein [Streptomyces sp. B1866]|uniref:protein-arginine deiminase family protein n=1 Tax=Streptomyces sp. B1866 TaxID=3075431 RepID=UPI00288CE3D1|nr:protein-arginine deiminase family protein [Streptomyces sp. B1866]MDT3399737.1 protein-arginine deiminase family protein [Streptomyces sp. B1866]